VGALAAPFTGGVGAGLAAMGAGTSLGGLVGGAVSPAKAESPRAVPLSRLAEDPGVQLAALEETKKLIAQRPEFQGPEGDEALKHVRSAQEKLRERMKVGRLI